jgi:hypothetical protein
MGTDAAIIVDPVMLDGHCDHRREVGMPLRVDHTARVLDYPTWIDEYMGTILAGLAHGV